MCISLAAVLWICYSEEIARYLELWFFYQVVLDFEFCLVILRICSLADEVCMWCCCFEKERTNIAN
jgi:hypothetical protein